MPTWRIVGAAADTGGASAAGVGGSTACGLLATGAGGAGAGVGVAACAAVAMQATGEGASCGCGDSTHSLHEGLIPVCMLSGESMGCMAVDPG